jgi:hypothetical protein
MRSGRLRVDVYAPWFEEKAMPRGCAGAMRDGEGWWQTVPTDIGRQAVRRAFPGLEVSGWSDRFLAFNVVE